MKISYNRGLEAGFEKIAITLLEAGAFPLAGIVGGLRTMKDERAAGNTDNKSVISAGVGAGVGSGLGAYAGTHAASKAMSGISNSTKALNFLGRMSSKHPELFKSIESNPRTRALAMGLLGAGAATGLVGGGVLGHDIGRNLGRAAGKYVSSAAFGDGSQKSAALGDIALGGGLGIYKGKKVHDKLLSEGVTPEVAFNRAVGSGVGAGVGTIGGTMVGGALGGMLGNAWAARSPEVLRALSNASTDNLDDLLTGMSRKGIARLGIGAMGGLALGGLLGGYGGYRGGASAGDYIGKKVASTLMEALALAGITTAGGLAAARDAREGAGKNEALGNSLGGGLGLTAGALGTASAMNSIIPRNAGLRGSIALLGGTLAGGLAGHHLGMRGGSALGQRFDERA
jgi:hypothetical protein